MIPRRCKNDRQSAILYARVIVNGDHREISTKEKILITSWNSSQEKVTGKSAEVLAINKNLENIKFRIRQHYRELRDKNFVITAQLIKDAGY
ncbi:MAG: hypothetical protein J7497_14470 [Chitinophagaceae bacterium]|nr:hypothetical protein [Chitinophagaceae bacterium]